MKLSREVSEIFKSAEEYANKNLFEFIGASLVLKEVLKVQRIEEIIKEISTEDMYVAFVEELEKEIDRSGKRVSGATAVITPDVETVIDFACIDSAGRGEGSISIETLFTAFFFTETGVSEIIEELEEEERLEILKRVNDYEIKGEAEEEKVFTGAQKWKNHVRDLKEVARKRQEPLIGREEEIDEITRILCKKKKSNVIMTGDPGVGKTEVAVGFARLVLENKVPDKLRGKQVLEIDVTNLVAGTKYRGDFEAKIDAIIKGAEAEGNVIFYIDEIHQIIGTGGNEGMDMGNMLKKALVEGKMSFIGSTTTEEYRKLIEKDSALKRRFGVIDVVEPTKEETFAILQGIRKYYEDFHHVTYSDEVLNKMISLTSKYMFETFFPDKAIDILDESGAQLSKMMSEIPTTPVEVTEKLVEEIVAKKCKMPIETVSESEAEKILSLEGKISKEVFGQEEAIKELVEATKISRAGLSAKNKPVGNFLLVGPTGTGKTQVAKSLASNLGLKLVKFNMSEYQEQFDVQKLIGSPAGFVGYEDGGLLVEAIRKNPYCVLLLDEIEKAHESIYKILLQVMDEGILQDSKGRMANFKNVILIMTSNAGAANMYKSSISFTSSEKKIDKSAIANAVAKTFKPEFRARLTSIVTFNGLSKDMGERIAGKTIDEMIKLLEERELPNVSYTEAVKDYVVEKGVTVEEGARKIELVVDKDLKRLFVDGLLDGSLKSKEAIQIDIEDGKPVLSFPKPKAKKAKKEVETEV